MKRSILLYDLNTYQLIKELGSHDAGIRDLAFSPDSKILASCGDNGKVFVWDVETKQLIHTFDYGKYHEVNNIEFSKDSKYLIVGDGIYEGSTIQVYDLNNNNKIFTYQYLAQTYLDVRFDNLIIAGHTQLMQLLNPKWNFIGIDEPIEPATIIYPNPVDMNVNIEFIVNSSRFFNIELLELNGIIIDSVFSGLLEPGYQKIPYNCTNIANGTYFIRITGNSFTKTYKLVKEGREMKKIILTVIFITVCQSVYSQNYEPTQKGLIFYGDTLYLSSELKLLI